MQITKRQEWSVSHSLISLLCWESEENWAPTNEGGGGCQDKVASAVDGYAALTSHRLDAHVIGVLKVECYRLPWWKLKRWTILSVGKDTGHWNAYVLLVAMSSGTTTLENIGQFLIELNIHIIWSRQATPRCLAKRNENIGPHSDVYMNVYSKNNLETGSNPDSQQLVNCGQRLLYIHTGRYCTEVERNGLLTEKCKNMGDSEMHYVSERSQTFIRSKKDKMIVAERGSVAAWARGGRESFCRSTGQLKDGEEGERYPFCVLIIVEVAR